LAQSAAASTGMVQVLSTPSIQDGSGSLSYTFSYVNRGNSGNSQNMIQFVTMPGGLTSPDQSNTSFTINGQTQSQTCLINAALTGNMTITFATASAYADNYVSGMTVRFVVTATANPGTYTVTIQGQAPASKVISSPGWSEWTYTGSIAKWVETASGSL
jgi:hypothetical protein